jgi:hypothetical protein
MGSDLLPCPFCGNEAVLRDVGGRAPAHIGACTNKQCPSCWGYATEAEAVAAWNTRTESAEVQKLRAVAEAARAVRDLGHDCLDCWGTWTGTAHESLKDDDGEWLDCSEVEMQEGWEPCKACQLRAALAALDNPNNQVTK